jgi:hypothetical protein
MTWWEWAVLGLLLAVAEIFTPGGFFFIFFGLAGGSRRDCGRGDRQFADERVHLVGGRRAPRHPAEQRIAKEQQ